MAGRNLTIPIPPDPLVQRCPDGVIFSLTVADTYDILPALAIVGVFDDPLHGCLRKATESTSMRFPRSGKIHPTWMSRWKLGSMVRINGLFHLLINGVYWGCNPLPKHLLTSWGIQTGNLTWFT